jgi:hypothetical protein
MKGIAGISLSSPRVTETTGEAGEPLHPSAGAQGGNQMMESTPASIARIRFEVEPR